MSKEITLTDLVEKAKTDLFSTYKGTNKEGKIVYPIFLVDHVELEVEIELNYEADSGLKISIPQFVEGSFTGTQGKRKTHKMKISLSPILSKEELRELMSDDRTMKGIREASLIALRKGEKLAGEE